MYWSCKAGILLLLQQWRSYITEEESFSPLWLTKQACLFQLLPCWLYKRRKKLSNLDIVTCQGTFSVKTSQCKCRWLWSQWQFFSNCYSEDSLLNTLRPLRSLFPSPIPSLTGTTERVCLIQGTVEALNGVHNFIAEKVREMPQSAQKPEPVSILQPQTTVNPDRVKQVRRCVQLISLTAQLFSSDLFRLFCSPWPTV